MSICKRNSKYVASFHPSDAYEELLSICLLGGEDLPLVQHWYIVFYLDQTDVNLLFLLNYRLFQKLKLIGNGEFNHLTTVLTLFIKYYNVIFKSAIRHRHFFQKQQHEFQLIFSIKCGDALKREIIILMVPKLLGQLALPLQSFRMCLSLPLFQRFLWLGTYEILNQFVWLEVCINCTISLLKAVRFQILPLGRLNVWSLESEVKFLELFAASLILKWFVIM